MVGDVSADRLGDLGPRFEAYARRMRELHFDHVVEISLDGGPETRRVLHESVFQCWTPVARRMFPHISSLIIPVYFFCYTRHHEHAFLAAVAQPGDVTSLNLELADTFMTRGRLPPDMRKLFVALAPRLHEMDVASTSRVNKLPPVPWINDLIEHTAELHNLRCGIPLPFSLVGQAIQTGYLRALTLELPVYGAPFGAAEIAWPTQALANLTTLSVVDNTPSAWLAQALVARCGTALRRCTIELCAQDAYVFSEVVTLLCAISRLPGIHALEIDIAQHARTTPEAEQTMAIFKALCNLSYLRQLHLSLGWEDTLSVAFLRTLLNACVFLTSFTTVGKEPDDEPRAFATLPEFLGMLQSRPMCLHLPVHIRITEFPDEATRTIFGTHAYSAYLVYEPTSDAKEGEFLDVIGALLPRVSQVVAWEPYRMPAGHHDKTDEGRWCHKPY
jgi:hypothetical protein